MQTSWCDFSSITVTGVAWRTTLGIPFVVHVEGFMKSASNKSDVFVMFMKKAEIRVASFVMGAFLHCLETNSLLLQ